jgi:hypothetical protein
MAADRLRADLRELRLFNDSYVGVVIALLLCTLVIGDASLRPALSVAAASVAA